MHRTTLLIGILLLTGSPACDSGGGITSTPGPDSGSYASDAFAVVDAEDAFSSLEEATLDAAMAMPSAFQSTGGFSRKARHPRGGGSHLGPILVDLGLDPSQRERIRDLIREQHALVRPLLESIRAVNADIIGQANEDRRAIVEAFLGGTITRDEALAQVRELNEATQEAIRNNPANEPLLEQICGTRRGLFGRIRAILTDDQAATWDVWVAGLDDDCLNGV